MKCQQSVYRQIFACFPVSNVTLPALTCAWCLYCFLSRKNSPSVFGWYQEGESGCLFSHDYSLNFILFSASASILKFLRLLLSKADGILGFPTVDFGLHFLMSTNSITTHPTVTQVSKYGGCHFLSCCLHFVLGLYYTFKKSSRDLQMNERFTHKITCAV